VRKDGSKSGLVRHVQELDEEYELVKVHAEHEPPKTREYHTDKLQYGMHTWNAKKDSFARSVERFLRKFQSTTWETHKLDGGGGGFFRGSHGA
jgi:hypothetical protein